MKTQHYSARNSRQLQMSPINTWNCVNFIQHLFLMSNTISMDFVDTSKRKVHQGLSLTHLFTHLFVTIVANKSVLNIVAYCFQEEMVTNPAIWLVLNTLFPCLGSVSIEKNCDLGLENADLASSPGLHFQDLGCSFSLHRSPRQQITQYYVQAEDFPLFLLWQ